MILDLFNSSSVNKCVYKYADCQGNKKDSMQEPFMVLLKKLLSRTL